MNFARAVWIGGVKTVVGGDMAISPNGIVLGYAAAAKIGSLIVHFEEATSADGHPFDAMAVKTLLDDLQVQAFLATLREYAMLPRKRSDDRADGMTATLVDAKSITRTRPPGAPQKK